MAARYRGNCHALRCQRSEIRTRLRDVVRAASGKRVPHSCTVCVAAARHAILTGGWLVAALFRHPRCEYLQGRIAGSAGDHEVVRARVKGRASDVQQRRHTVAVSVAEAARGRSEIDRRVGDTAATEDNFGEAIDRLAWVLCSPEKCQIALTYCRVVGRRVVGDGCAAGRPGSTGLIACAWNGDGYAL